MLVSQAVAYSGQRKKDTTILLLPTQTEAVERSPKKKYSKIVILEVETIYTAIRQTSSQTTLE